MKTNTFHITCLRLLYIAVTIGLLSGCGQTGPLTLPEEKAALDGSF